MDRFCARCDTRRDPAQPARTPSYTAARSLAKRIVTSANANAMVSVIASRRRLCFWAGISHLIVIHPGLFPAGS
jgi:hypothetical protein